MIAGSALTSSSTATGPKTSSWNAKGKKGVPGNGQKEDMGITMQSIRKASHGVAHGLEPIDAMNKEFSAITGSRGMGAIPDNLREQLKDVIANPPGWEDIRKKYPDFEGLDAPKAAAVYDVIAKGDARLQGLQGLAEQRMDQVNSLMQRIDSANDPAAKQDLANRLASEQAAIQAAAALAQIVAQKQETDVRQAEVEAQREFFEKEWKLP
jgi:type IV secretion system protein VirB5